MAERFTIERGRWYAWTMYPGYVDMPYLSPIRVDEIEPLGQRRFRLAFLNAGYAVGVNGFDKTLRTLARRERFCVCEEVGETSDLGRVMVIQTLTWEWIDRNFPQVRQRAPGVGDVQAALAVALERAPWGVPAF